MRFDAIQDVLTGRIGKVTFSARDFADEKALTGMYGIISRGGNVQFIVNSRGRTTAFSVKVRKRHP